MSKSDAFENDLLKLVFWGTPIANLADNAASAPLASLYVSLHTADPGEAGAEATNECSYTGYARLAVVRSASGWAIAANVATPVANLDFGQKTAGADQTATYFAVGVASAGAQKILYSGPISPTISIVNGTIPRLTTATQITED